MKIMIEDNEDDIKSNVKMVFTKPRFEVIRDANGGLVEKQDRDLPDLIILDINLNNKDGGDICARLKKNLRTRHIPIILISAIMDLKQISQYCGADDYLIKPFNISELENKVMMHLRHAA